VSRFLSYPAATVPRMDPNNPTVQLCIRGMQAEGRGDPVGAKDAFQRAWLVATDDFDACVAAHYLARAQPTAEGALHWNLESLSRAMAVGDERVRDFYPSLHINLGHAYGRLGRQAEAHRHYLLAAEQIASATPAGGDRYDQWIREGVVHGLRTHAAGCRPADRCRADQLIAVLLPPAA
jgi:hypothetical protein